MELKAVKEYEDLNTKQKMDLHCFCDANPFFYLIF